jgi:hypothetical protein
MKETQNGPYVANPPVSAREEERGSDQYGKADKEHR